jgi:hypothetical protein
MPQRRTTTKTRKVVAGAAGAMAARATMEAVEKLAPNALGLSITTLPPPFLHPGPARTVAYTQ